MRSLYYRSHLFLLCLIFSIVSLLAFSGCRVTDLPIWNPTLSHDAYQVEVKKGIAYYHAKEADSHRNRLDLFVPKGEGPFPVVFFVHGGAWMVGDNRCCGLYSSIGEFLASRGIIAVLPNYRLSPSVKHPKHIKDVARAFAWVRANIGRFKGRSDQVFLMGHSAGGHLVTLMATDEKYLQEHELSAKDIRGVISLSGVYRIPSGKVAGTLGGTTPEAFRLDEMFPLRRPCDANKLNLPGIPVHLNVFGPAFGNDKMERAKASPINHIRPGLPPFLLFSAENDLPLLPGMAKEFHQGLLEKGVDARMITVQKRNHNSIMFHACTMDDPVAKQILEFIQKHTR